MIADYITRPCVLWLNNPFDLNDAEQSAVEPGITIRQWIDENGGDDRLNFDPTVCVYQGKELLRSEYDQAIEGPVCFVTLPQGGNNKDGGSNPLQIVAMIVVAYLSYGAGTAASAAYGGSTAAGFAASSAVMIAGSMLVNAVFPPPGLPDSAKGGMSSPTYSAGAQGNSARIGAPIPVNYGIMRIYPDFAAQPYTEYHDNEQFLYQLFCIGQGHHKVHTLRLDNTPLENFDDVKTEIIQPLEKVTLFHTAVVVAPEAGGQDMSEPIALGPYVINNVDTEISRISVDIVFPGGLIGVDTDDGDEYSVAVEIGILVDPIDDKGHVTGETIIAFSEYIRDQTRTAIRKSIAFDLDPGRYQVTIKRYTNKGGSSESMGCQLGAVKGYLVDDNEYGDLTLLAIRIRATANLSDAASRLVNCIVERQIPIWSADDGWSSLQVTANPAWCFADAARSRYGGDFSDTEIDLNGLLYLAGLFDSRHDEFNGRFDTEQSLWDGLGKIGQVVRSAPIRQGNLLRMIRDQAQPAPVAQFSMANMTDFSLDFVMHNDRTADSVKVTYWDKARDYAQTTVLCKLPDETSDNPKEITLFGCTDYEQAWREGMYLAASNRDRRQLASWKTEMEGYIPTFGDVVWVNHDLLGAGEVFSGVVEQQVGDSLLLSRDIKMPGDNWYLVIRDRLGKPSSPIRVAQSGENVVRLLDTLPFSIEDDPYRERTHFMIGRGKQYAWPIKVTSITPESDDRITIAGCIESDFVHTADQGQVPPPPPDLIPPPPGLVIEGLISTQGGTVQNPVVMLSWKLARGADRYLVEVSRDGRKTWQPGGTGMTFIPQHEFTLQPGLVTCRVAAVAAIRGDWAMIEVNAGGEFDKPGKVSVQLSEPFIGDTLKVKWTKEPAAARYLIEVLYNGSRARAMYVDRSVLEYSYHWQDAQQDGAGRTLTVQVRAQNAENINGDWGRVTATNPPPAVPDGLVVDGLIDAFIVRADRPDDTDIREFRCYGSQTKGFTPAIANLLATSQTPWINLNLTGVWYFRAAWVDQWGADDLNVSGELKGESSAVDTSEIQKDIDGIQDSLDKIKGDVDSNIKRIDSNVEGNRTDLANFEETVNTDLSGVRSDITGLGTDITTEESKRVEGDTALSKRITTVSADLSDETTNRTAAIKTESDARANQDEALGKRVDTVAADLSTETSNRTAAINTESTARAKEDETLASQIRTVASELDDETAQRTAAIKSEETARTSADQSLSKKIDTVQSGYKSADGKLDAAIKSETTARSTADEALGKRVDKTVADFQSADKKIQGSVTSESKARADGDTALGRRVDTVTADYKKADKANTAAIQSESKARADADKATAEKIDTVQASLGDIKKLGKNPDFSLKGQYWSLSDRGETVPENLDGSWSSSVTVAGGFSYWVRGKEQTIYSANAIPVDVSRKYRVRARVRQWKDPTDTSKSYTYIGVSCLGATYQPINGSGTHHRRYCAANKKLIKKSEGWHVYEGIITGVEGSKTDNNKFSSSNVRFVRLCAYVNYPGGNGEALIDLLEFEDITDEESLKAAVQVTSEAVAKVEDGVKKLDAKWGVSLDVNGYCSGFKMNNDGKQAEALFRADLFAVGKPGVESFSFVIDGNKVAIPGNLVAGGSITGDQIKANSIEAGHLKANSITAGKIAAQAVTAQKLAADVADFMVANIGDGSIDNAKIGNYIQSHDYKTGQSGWQINKNGLAEFQNILARGRIIGSIIEGSFIVEGTTKWYATTEADNGREPRYFTYAAPVIKTISKNHEITLYSKSVDDYRKRREIKKTINVGVIPIVSANYTGSGTTTVSPEGGTDKVKIYSNVERFKNYKNNLSINISGSMPYVHIERYEIWWDGGGSTDASAYVRAHSIKIAFTIKKGSTVLSKSTSSSIDLTNSDIDTSFKFSGYSVHLVCTGQLFRCYFGRNNFSVYVPTNYIIDVKSPLLDIKGNSNTTIDYELLVNAGTTGVRETIARVREQRDSLGKTVVSVKSQTLERNDA